MSDSLRPHGLQHTSPPCPSPTPGVYPNSCPLSWWFHSPISSCHPLLLLPSIFPSIRVFSKESVLPIRWPKYWSFSFNISLGIGEGIIKGHENILDLEENIILIVVKVSQVYCCSVAKLCLTLCEPHGLQPARFLCSWNFPGKNTGVSCHLLLQVYTYVKTCQTINFKLFLNKAIKFFSAFKLMFVDSVCDWVLSDTHSI